MKRSWLVLIFLLTHGVHSADVSPRDSGVTLQIIQQRMSPVVKKGDPGTEGNAYGFEGGRVIKWRGAYHLFTSEMVGDPMWVKMRLAHWISKDRLHWRRNDTMYSSSGENSGKDPRASLWAPMPVYDDKAKLWNLFYVAYRAPVGPDNWHGRLWRAVSTKKGPDGLSGPWRDVGIILQPDALSQSWENVQGTDSVFPYKVGDRWIGFYGSSDAASWWKVGLMQAPNLSGPWKRCTNGNPTTLNSDLGTENPVVTRLKSGRYVAVFDTIREPGSHSIGYADSQNGIRWSLAKQLVLEQCPGWWVQDMRTPLGLIPEEDGSYTLFYTGYAKTDGYGCVGMLRLRLQETSLGNK